MYRASANIRSIFFSIAYSTLTSGRRGIGFSAISAMKISNKVLSHLPIKLKQVALPNHNGKAANAGSAGRYDAGLELVVGDGGALDSSPDQIAIQTVGQVAAIESV